MYTLTRQEASDILGVSTRSIDRYIKSGKLRSKKDGKIVYIHNGDVENISGNSSEKQEVIVEKKQTYKEAEPKKQKIITKETQLSSKNSETTLEKIYDDLKNEIIKKDEIIRELAIRVGEAEEKSKNSVQLVDYKKSQFLLEESRNYLNNEIEDLKDENTILSKKYRYERTSNIILIFAVIVLLAIAGIIWFLNI